MCAAEFVQRVFVELPSCGGCGGAEPSEDGVGCPAVSGGLDDERVSLVIAVVVRVPEAQLRVGGVLYVDGIEDDVGAVAGVSPAIKEQALCAEGGLQGTG